MAVNPIDELLDAMEDGLPRPLQKQLCAETRLRIAIRELRKSVQDMSDRGFYRGGRIQWAETLIESVADELRDGSKA